MREIFKGFSMLEKEWGKVAVSSISLMIINF
jgi:hypothetical protein